MTMVTQVFTRKGDTKSIADAYVRLANLNPNDPYNKQKAAGSLGGSSASGFLKKEGRTYIRTR